MFNPDFTAHLKPPEEVLQLVRPTWIVYGLHFGLASLIIILAFFFLYPLIHWADIGFLFFFLILLVGLIYWLRTYLIYSRTALLISDRRVMDFNQKGLFHQEVSEIIFANIEDISYNKKGIVATLFNYGTLEIQTAAQKITIEIKGIKRPDQIQNLITDVKTGQ